MVWSGCPRCGVLLLAALALGGCRPPDAAPTPPAVPRETSPDSPRKEPGSGGLPADRAADELAKSPAAATRLHPEPDGLHNVFQVSAQVYSGSEPHGGEAFDSLVALGVKTIVSVDGAQPQVALARERGLRYVHIPIGYDGIPEQARLALARVMRESDGPVYIHCHHGKHRGPAAAAVACRAAGQLDAATAEGLLVLAGTSRDYSGLYRDVREFVAPQADQPLPELVEVATVESWVSGMADLGRHFDDLKLCREARWQTPTAHPDLVPRGVARLVQEGLHEMGRTADLSAYPGEFRSLLQASDETADRLCQALAGADQEAVEREFAQLEKSCRQCHAQWRDH
jgi:protein tyrosine phosphatase (PTP) superfamily phosphohydrolase (DUF442 family)